MSAAVVAVTVVWATPAAQDVVPLVLPAGATVGDAVTRSGLVDRYRIDLGTVRLGIRGRRAREDTVLTNGDRVEICRALVADPKDARRTRAGTRNPAAPKPRGDA